MEKCISAIKSDEVGEVSLVKSTWVSQLSRSMSTSQFKSFEYDQIRESNFIKNQGNALDESARTSRNRPLSSSIRPPGHSTFQGGFY
jgi:hypothetical protein